MRVRLEWEELWMPWRVNEEGDGRHGEWEVPDDLVVRFKIARDEMDAVWDELTNYTNSEDRL